MITAKYRAYRPRGNPIYTRRTIIADLWWRDRCTATIFLRWQPNNHGGMFTAHIRPVVHALDNGVVEFHKLIVRLTACQPYLGDFQRRANRLNALIKQRRYENSD